MTSIILASLPVFGCTDAKRTAYETLESMRIKQCLDQPEDAPDCPTQRQRYDKYDADYRQHTETAEPSPPE
ncbi:MAG: hypothetical protein KZQ93_08075 [Candidatus Thiodiazotropha sp. (ex Monitilora ramsayi)]|nr:hypothetical protein [Candidatus Thiodiazotropha sp. (ex Monitilora ramsayi)]